MKESQIIKYSAIIALIGLISLFFFSENVNLANIEEFTPVEEIVEMEGKISSLRKHEKAYFLKVDGLKKETIDVIFFPEEDVFLEEGSYVSVEGVVEEYKGKREIIASVVKIK